MESGKDIDRDFRPGAAFGLAGPAATRSARRTLIANVFDGGEKTKVMHDHRRSGAGRNGAHRAA